jgi:CheY-like chemotaxis protein
VQPSNSRPSGTGRRLLVVDDEETILALVGSYFRRLGCTVDVARDPGEAEARLSEARYDAVILDLRLTKLADADGLQVLRELRRRDGRAGAIVLSAHVSPELEEEARLAGANTVLRKPQRLPDLAQIAFALMEGETPAPDGR